MQTVSTLDRPYQPLLDWLAGQAIEYEIHEHDLAFTARSTAAAEGVDPRTFAKVVVVTSHDGKPAIIALDATDQLDLHKAQRVLGASDVRLLTEPELKALAPECDLGAIPAVGSLFGLTTYADYAVGEDPEISFNAGSHRFCARVDRTRWERACGAIYADLAETDETMPVWGRS
jgi:Ala-tRNA(Pro) deacylase